MDFEGDKENFEGWPEAPVDLIMEIQRWNFTHIGGIEEILHALERYEKEVKEGRNPFSMERLFDARTKTSKIVSIFIYSIDQSDFEIFERARQLVLMDVHRPSFLFDPFYGPIEDGFRQTVFIRTAIFTAIRYCKDVRICMGVFQMTPPLKRKLFTTEAIACEREDIIDGLLDHGYQFQIYDLMCFAGSESSTERYFLRVWTQSEGPSVCDEMDRNGMCLWEEACRKENAVMCNFLFLFGYKPDYRTRKVLQTKEKSRLMFEGFFPEEE